jgi:hypothetical protein
VIAVRAGRKGKEQACTGKRRGKNRKEEKEKKNKEKRELNNFHRWEFWERKVKRILLKLF